MRAVRHGLVVSQARPGGRDLLGRSQAMLLGLGILQIVLGCAVVSLSFAALAMTTYSRVRNACPYWAGFAAMLSGGVGMIAWKQQTSLAVSFFTFLSAVCVLLHLVAAVLSGESTTLLTSLNSCIPQNLGKTCQCLLGGTDMTCSGIQTLLKELMYAVCGTSVVACLVSALSVAVGCMHFIKRGSHQSMLYGHSLGSPVLPSDSLRTPLEDEMFPVNMVQPVPPPPYSPPGCYISQHGILSEDPPPYSAVDPLARITEIGAQWTAEAQRSVDDATRLSPSVEGACGTQAVSHSVLAVSHSGTLNNMLDSLQLASSFNSGQTPPNAKGTTTCESAELQRAVDMSLESVLQAFHEQTQQMDGTETNVRQEPTRNFRHVPHFTLPDATPSPQGAASLVRENSDSNVPRHGSRVRQDLKNKTQDSRVRSDPRLGLHKRHEEPLAEVSSLNGIQEDSHPQGNTGRKSKAERPKTLNLSGNAKLRKHTHRSHKKRPRSLVDAKDLKDTKVLVAQFLEQPVGNLPPAVQIVVENIKSVIQSDEHHLAEVMHSASVLQEVEVRHSTYRYSLSSTSSSSHVSSSGSVYRTVEVSSSTVCRTGEVSPSSAVCRTAEAPGAVPRTAEGLETAEDCYRETVL
ncbi:protein ENTREP2-like [Branchiostoma lanceolatum]|uniref:protein ENTREP2-like n=1 Tax=Branchiostoma lanceolatum TaxID=7740 RepID=UPI00345301B4